jgi:hypothetical protein
VAGVAAAEAAADGAVAGLAVVAAVGLVASEVAAASRAVARAGAGNMSMTLNAFVDAVRRAAGENIVAVVLFGSAAGRDYHGPASDHNVLVLVKRAAAADLTMLASAVHRWTRAGNPPPLVLTPAEWQRRSDVFALEYADLLEQHRVVFGTFTADAVRVRRRDLRLQLESEVMGKLMRFRRGVMSAGSEPRKLRELLEDSLSSMLTLLRGTLHLHGESAPASSETLCDRAGVLAGFDAAPFRAVVSHRRGTAPLRDGALGAIVAGYLEAIERLVAHVDGYAVDD